MNPNDIKYMATMAAIKQCHAQGIVDLTSEDFDFLAQVEPWTQIERSRVRRSLEACVYGAMDMVGVQRFAVPAEFIAGAIIYFVHPTNYMTPCSHMDGCEFSENIVNGVDQPLTASTLFAHVLQCAFWIVTGKRNR